MPQLELEVRHQGFEELSLGYESEQAVEKAFNVKVTAVNVMTVRGKTRRVGRQQVLTPSWRKAIVSLKPGDKIEIFEGV